jgi:nucleoid-associated protein YgaU
VTPPRRRRHGTLALLAVAVLASGTVQSESDVRVHEVRSGENLWRIARATVGDGTLWPALYRANRDQIKDPAILYPGQRLRIPELAPEERAALRRDAAPRTP